MTAKASSLGNQVSSECKICPLTLHGPFEDLLLQQRHLIVLASQLVQTADKVIADLIHGLAVVQHLLHLQHLLADHRPVSVPLLTLPAEAQTHTWS